jgi:hypothetical protein
MADAVSAISAPGAANSATAWPPAAESSRAIAAKDLAPGEIAPLESDLLVTELIAELTVHVALTSFVLARDEIRRQSEQISIRMKQAQEESE